MLYVFQVDTGSMKTFNMDLALESVSVLQNEIAQSCKVPESDQVFLISGGESLDPGIRVCTYNAGTDTNPIFLFNKSAIESSVDQPLVAGSIDDGDLLNQVKNALDLPVSYATLVRRTELSQKCYDAAVDILRCCDQLCHEQHLLQQSWAAVVANLDDITSAFQTRTDIFNTNFNEYLQTRDQNIKLLQSFSEDLSLLSKIPLLSALVENEEESQSSLQPDKQTLLEWISSKDNQSSLEQVAEQCRRGLEQTDSKIQDSLQNRIKESLNAASDDDIKEIKGLQIRLYRLDRFVHEAKELVKNQGGIMQSFIKNCRSASEMKEDSVLPDLCATHREQLQVIVSHHKQLMEIQNRCHLGKLELIKNIHTRLKWIMYIEVSIRDIDNKLVIYHENLKRLKRHLDIINQIHLAPQIYFELISEVVLRRKFSESFHKWASVLAEKSSKMLNEEQSRRKEVNNRVHSHFLISLFPGLDDMPPSFANKEPSLFDAKLPKIEESDVLELQKEFPDHKSKLNVQAVSEMPTLGSIPNQTEMNSNAKVNYISTSERTTWTYSTSPPEPAPSFQINEKTENDDNADVFIDAKQTLLEGNVKDNQNSGSSACISSFGEGSGSPELDESMPSSYTETSGKSAASPKHTQPINQEEIQKQLHECNIQMNNLRDQLMEKESHFKQNLKNINVKANISMTSSSCVKNKLSSLKLSALEDAKNFGTCFEQTTTKICDLILNHQNLIDSEKISLISEAKAKLQEENDKIISDLQINLKLCEEKLTSAEKNKEEMNVQAKNLETSVSELKAEIEAKDASLVEITNDYDLKIKQLASQHAIDVENVKKTANDQRQLLEDQIIHLEEMVSDMKLSKLSEANLRQEMEVEHATVISKLKEDYSHSLDSKLKECDLKNSNKVELMVKELQSDIEKGKEEAVDKACERIFREKEEIRMKLEELNDKKEAEIIALKEKMTLDHRNELESLRSRFKLAINTSSIMEKSISESSVERQESSKSTMDVTEHEQIVAGFKKELEQEKHKKMKELEDKHSKEIREIYEKLEKERLKTTPLKTSMAAEKQVLFNEAVSKVSAEKDQIIKELKLKVKMMTRLVEKSGSKEPLLTDISESLYEPESAVTNIGGVRPKISDSMTSSVMTLGFQQADENESLRELKAKLRFKQEELDIMKSKFMELSVTSSTESLIHSDKVSVLSCNVGDVVLLFFDEKYNNYAIFLLSPVLHFLHADSFENLNLDPTLKTKKMWALAEVVEKEYCQARKVQNRFKVEVGTKFYRVKAVPWSKEIMLRKEHQLRAIISSASSANKTGSL